MQTELSPAKVRLGDELGHLPEPDMCHQRSKDDCTDEFSYSAEAMRAYAAAQVDAERERLRGYFREALADKGITWPGEVDGLYAKCFEEPDAHLNTPNVKMNGGPGTPGPSVRAPG